VKVSEDRCQLSIDVYHIGRIYQPVEGIYLPILWQELSITIFHKENDSPQRIREQCWFIKTIEGDYIQVGMN